MAKLENIKNRLIDRIMVTKNEQLLSAIDSILNSTQTGEKLALDTHQIEMLLMSENDIKEGNIISESDLEKEDQEWMN